MTKMGAPPTPEIDSSIIPQLECRPCSLPEDNSYGDDRDLGDRIDANLRDADFKDCDCLAA